MALNRFHVVLLLASSSV